MYDRNTPTVTRQYKNSKIEVYIPYYHDTRSVLKGLLPEGAQFRWDKEIKRWVMSKKYLKKVASYLAKWFGRCVVYLDVSIQEKCTASCQSAKKRKVYECTCVCGGHSHGEGWPPEWKAVAEDLLVKDGPIRRDEILVTHQPEVSTNVVSGV